MSGLGSRYENIPEVLVEEKSKELPKLDIEELKDLLNHKVSLGGIVRDHEKKHEKQLEQFRESFLDDSKDFVPSITKINNFSSRIEENALTRSIRPKEESEKRKTSPKEAKNSRQKGKFSKNFKEKFFESRKIFTVDILRLFHPQLEEIWKIKIFPKMDLAVADSLARFLCEILRKSSLFFKGHESNEIRDTIAYRLRLIGFYTKWSFLKENPAKETSRVIKAASINMGFSTEAFRLGFEFLMFLLVNKQEPCLKDPQSLHQLIEMDDKKFNWLFLLTNLSLCSSDILDLEPIQKAIEEFLQSKRVSSPEKQKECASLLLVLLQILSSDSKVPKFTRDIGQFFVKLIKGPNESVEVGVFLLSSILDLVWIHLRPRGQLQRAILIIQGLSDSWTTQMIILNIIAVAASHFKSLQEASKKPKEASFEQEKKLILDLFHLALEIFSFFPSELQGQTQVHEKLHHFIKLLFTNPATKHGALALIQRQPFYEQLHTTKSRILSTMGSPPKQLKTFPTYTSPLTVMNDAIWFYRRTFPVYYSISPMSNFSFENWNFRETPEEASSKKCPNFGKVNPNFEGEASAAEVRKALSPNSSTGEVFDALSKLIGSDGIFKKSKQENQQKTPTPSSNSPNSWFQILSGLFPTHESLIKPVNMGLSFFVGCVGSGDPYKRDTGSREAEEVIIKEEMLKRLPGVRSFSLLGMHFQLQIGDFEKGQCPGSGNFVIVWNKNSYEFYENKQPNALMRLRGAEVVIVLSPMPVKNQIYIRVFGPELKSSFPSKKTKRNSVDWECVYFPLPFLERDSIVFLHLKCGFNGTQKGNVGLFSIQWSLTTKMRSTC